MKSDESEFLFSKELRDAMAPFGEMDVRECLNNVEFWKALCKHAGMDDNEFNSILNETSKPEDK